MSDHNEKKQLLRRDVLILAVARRVSSGVPALGRRSPRPPLPGSRRAQPCRTARRRACGPGQPHHRRSFRRRASTMPGRLCVSLLAVLRTQDLPAASRARPRVLPRHRVPGAATSAATLPRRRFLARRGAIPSSGDQHRIFDETKCLRTTEGSDCTECYNGCPGGAILPPGDESPDLRDLCDGDRSA